MCAQERSKLGSDLQSMARTVQLMCFVQNRIEKSALFVNRANFAQTRTGRPHDRSMQIMCHSVSVLSVWFVLALLAASVHRSQSQSWQCATGSSCHGVNCLAGAALSFGVVRLVVRCCPSLSVLSVVVCALCAVLCCVFNTGHLSHTLTSATATADSTAQLWQ